MTTAVYTEKLTHPEAAGVEQRLYLFFGGKAQLANVRAPVGNPSASQEVARIVVELRRRPDGVYD